MPAIVMYPVKINMKAIPRRRTFTSGIEVWPMEVTEFEDFYQFPSF